ILDWYTESLHEGSRILAEALLPGNEGIAVMLVFHLPLEHVGRNADVVMRAKNEARPLALEKLADRFDLCRIGLLLGDHVIEAEHHERVRISEHALVDGEPLP